MCGPAMPAMERASGVIGQRVDPLMLNRSIQIAEKVITLQLIDYTRNQAPHFTPVMRSQSILPIMSQDEKISVLLPDLFPMEIPRRIRRSIKHLSTEPVMAGEKPSSPS